MARGDHDPERTPDPVEAKLARLPNPEAVRAARQVLDGVQRHRKATGKRRLARRELAAYVREMHDADRTGQTWAVLADLYALGAKVVAQKKGVR